MLLNILKEENRVDVGLVIAVLMIISIPIGLIAGTLYIVCYCVDKVLRWYYDIRRDTGRTGKT
jgi:hypothetical protein